MLGNEKRVLELGGSLAVGGNGSPVIGPRDILMHPGIDHGLDGKDVAGFHEAGGFVAGVVGDVGGAVEEGAGPVAAVGPVDRQTM